MTLGTCYSVYRFVHIKQNGMLLLTVRGSFLSISVMVFLHSISSNISELEFDFLTSAQIKSYKEKLLQMQTDAKLIIMGRLNALTQTKCIHLKKVSTLNNICTEN